MSSRINTLRADKVANLEALSADEAQNNSILDSGQRQQLREQVSNIERQLTSLCAGHAKSPVKSLSARRDSNPIPPAPASSQPEAPHTPIRPKGAEPASIAVTPEQATQELRKSIKEARREIRSLLVPSFTNFKEENAELVGNCELADILDDPQHAVIRKSYQSHCMESLVTENFEFMIASHPFLQVDDPRVAAEQGRKLHDEFIRQGSGQEINISNTQRLAIEGHLEALDRSVTPGSVSRPSSRRDSYVWRADWAAPKEKAASKEKAAPKAKAVGTWVRFRRGVMGLFSPSKVRH